MEFFENATFPDIHRARLYIHPAVEAFTQLSLHVKQRYVSYQTRLCASSSSSSCVKQPPRLSVSDDNLPIILLTVVELSIRECDIIVAGAMSEDFCRWRGEVKIHEDDGPLQNSREDLYVLYCTAESGLLTLPARNTMLMESLQILLQYVRQSVVTAMDRLFLNWADIWDSYEHLFHFGKSPHDEPSSVVSSVVLDRLDFFDADPHAGGDPVFLSFIELPHSVSTKLVYKPRGDSGNFWLSGFVERILHNSANVVNFDSTHHNRVSSDEDETILSDDQLIPQFPFILSCCSACHRKIMSGGSSCTCFIIGEGNGATVRTMPVQAQQHSLTPCCYSWETMIPSRTSGTSSSTNSSATTNNNISGDQAFQMRCGALLAFAACVRLTDGHMQNVIRTPDDFPVLIDGETVLTPQPGGIAPDRCAPDDLVLLTGLIEDLRESKKDGRVLNGATSAFQTKYVSKTFRPVIIADGTNEFRVEFVDQQSPPATSTDESTATMTQHQKQLTETPHFAFLHTFGEPFFSGFRRALDIISRSITSSPLRQHSKPILWASTLGVTHRVVLRPTVHYKLLMHKHLLLFASDEARQHILSALQKWRPLLPSFDGGELVNRALREWSDTATTIAEAVEIIEAAQLASSIVPVWMLVSSQHNGDCTELCILENKSKCCDAATTFACVLTPVARFSSGGVSTFQPSSSSWCGAQAAEAGTKTLVSDIDAAVESLRRLVGDQPAGMKKTDEQPIPTNPQDTASVMRYLHQSVEYWSSKCFVMNETQTTIVVWEFTNFYSGSLGVACALALGGQWNSALMLLNPILAACDDIASTTADDVSGNNASTTTPSESFDSGGRFQRWMNHSIGITGVGGLLFGLSIILKWSSSGSCLSTRLHKVSQGCTESDEEMEHLPLRVATAAFAVVTFLHRMFSSVRRDRDDEHHHHHPYDMEIINGFGGLLIGLAAIHKVCRQYITDCSQETLQGHSATSKCAGGCLPKMFATISELQALVRSLTEMLVTRVIIPSQDCDGSFPRKDRKPPYSGLSHGQSGIALALARTLSIFTGSDDKHSQQSIGIVEAIVRCIQLALSFEDGPALVGTREAAEPQYYWKDMRNPTQSPLSCTVPGSWCHGASGILLARHHIRILVAPLASLLGIKNIHESLVEANIRASLVSQNDFSCSSTQLSDLCCGPLCSSRVRELLQLPNDCQCVSSISLRLAPSAFNFHPSCLYKGVTGLWVTHLADASSSCPDILSLDPFPTL